jgi:hypothetical protein
MSAELNAKIDAYYEARADYDAKHKASSDADKVRRARERELVDYMIEHQIKKVSRNDGTTPLLVSATSIACNQENAEQIRKWLVETEGDDSDYMVNVLSKPAVLELVKKKIKQGDDPTEFPEFLKVDARPTLRVDGWKTVSDG